MSEQEAGVGPGPTPVSVVCGQEVVTRLGPGAGAPGHLFAESQTFRLS